MTSWCEAMPFPAIVDLERALGRLEEAERQISALKKTALAQAIMIERTSTDVVALGRKLRLDTKTEAAMLRQMTEQAGAHDGGKGA